MKTTSSEIEKYMLALALVITLVAGYFLYKVLARHLQRKFDHNTVGRTVLLVIIIAAVYVVEVTIFNRINTIMNPQDQWSLSYNFLTWL